MHHRLMLRLLTRLLSLSTLLAALPISPDPTIRILSPLTEIKPQYCPPSTSPSSNCRVLTLTHSTTTGTILDIDILDSSCMNVGSAHGVSYSKKANILTSLTQQSGKNYVYVTPQGMQGTMTPEVKYMGKNFGDDGKRCYLDRDIDGWVCAVDFLC